MIVVFTKIVFCLKKNKFYSIKFSVSYLCCDCIISKFMKILIVHTAQILVLLYGVTERVIWSLGKELVKLGHNVTFLVKKGSYCDFADVLFIDENISIVEHIKNTYDIVHFNFQPSDIGKLKIKYKITMQENANSFEEFDKNTVFVSKNHANRYNSDSYVYNGLDWNDYSMPDFILKKENYHFLANASWMVKNLKGAIEIINKIENKKLMVLDGVRFNFKMGIRFTFSAKIKFYGMVGGEKKFRLLNKSKGLIFAVLWYEPFGLAIIESLFYGCPVFATPYGSLPELITHEIGFLSNKKDELRMAIENSDSFSPQKCHQYADDLFNSKIMAENYLLKYQLVLTNKYLNKVAPKLKEQPQANI